jgi:hypothetical protein
VLYARRGLFASVVTTKSRRAKKAETGKPQQQRRITATAATAAVGRDGKLGQEAAERVSKKRSLVIARDMPDY